MRLCLIMAALALLVAAAPASSQKPKKGSKEQQNQQTAMPRLPDSDEIDREISEMLAAWQVGETNLLHRFYADDATFVSGAYEPVIQGWVNYQAIYDRQRAHLEGVRMDRRNTYINVKGDIAWASYQWEFGAQYDGRPITGSGQTTLILQRRNNAWVILHNHTSQICEAPAAQPQSKPAVPKP